MNKDQTLKVKNSNFSLTQNAIFDWLEFTIFYDEEEELIQSFIENRISSIVRILFNISFELFESDDRGRNGYNHLYYYKNINIWTSPNYNMGIHFEITGQGCRDVENLGITFKDLLNNINRSYKVKYSRIDLSIDDFTNDYYNVGKIRYYLENNLISSRLRTYYLTTSGNVENNKLKGQTIQFGNKSSLLHITFYNKLLERENNDYIVDNSIKYWTRTELRFRNEFACDVVDLVSNGKEINLIIKGILKDKIRFLSKTKVATRKENTPTAYWWLEFLNNCDTIKLNNPKVYNEIAKSRKWLYKGVSKTNFMVYLSEIETTEITDNITSNYLYNFIVTGADKIKVKDLRIVNSARINNNLFPLQMSDIESIINELKEHYKLKEN